MHNEWAAEGVYVNQMLFSLTNLLQRCLQAEQAFHRGEHSNRSACLEIFRRAIILREEEAWSALFTVYRPQVESWLRRHPRFYRSTVALPDLVDMVFSRYWKAMTPERFERRSPWSMLQIMAYLRRTTESTLHDVCRFQRPREDLIELSSKTDPPADELVLGNMGKEQLWKSVQEALQDDQERLAIELVYRQGWYPREVAHEYPDIFPDVHLVYVVLNRVIRRLRRHWNNDASWKR